ncbi:MAG: hypothetical protein IT534_00050, partial [Bauldia sp.]|nr:hypothetical protein [Bauldia sp.]
MTDSPSDDRLRDSEIALVDALKLIMEVMVATGTVKATVFEQIFAQQRDAYIAKTMPNAAVIMEVLRGFAAKPPKPAAPARRPELDEPP